MSFSQDVKQEIASHIPLSRHCRIAELSGLYFLCGESGVREGVDSISFHTENIEVARLCFTLLKKTFNITVNACVKRSKLLSYAVGVFGRDAENVKETLKISEDINRSIKLLTEKDCCRRVFLSGVFLVSGSMNDPERSYHLEIVCEDEGRAELLREMICSFGIEARSAVRKKYHVIYVKEGDGIVDMLNIMDANRALLSMENTRVLKDMRNRVNRSVNCETANIKKTVGAAVRQINDIEFLMETGNFKELDEGLKQIALLRLENKEATLTELGEMLNPPVGKSGVNHRLRKISDIAGMIRGI
ncbi:MAG: DNA-binding protein WhiA [Lachnospiraceae bacterium]|nr:DNA-binding protein WhiA [Lachnospiraceae bacterium]